MSHWHYAMLELAVEDQLVRPMIGPETNLTREQAHTTIQGLLDRFAQGSDPTLIRLARIWRQDAKDDTVAHPRFIFTIFECDEPTCAATFTTWAEEWTGILRQSGLQVDMARYPDG